MMPGLERRLARRFACTKLTLAGLGVASLLAMSCALSPAQAQYWRDGDYYDGPMGPDRYYGGYSGYPDYPGRADRPDAGMSLADVRQKVADRGMHLVATPRRKGRIYLAETEDAHGIRHRLVFDAVAGRLIENTVLGPKTPVVNQTRPLQPTPPQRPTADDVSRQTIEPPPAPEPQAK
jgi:hypothetical protein